MFLVTKDEIEAGCSVQRYDPGLRAQPWTEDARYDAVAGKPLPEGVTPAEPIAIAEALKDVFDPEIPVNAYDLGLIYDISVSPSGDTAILMTLTAPNCPAAEILPGEIAQTAAAVEGVGRVGVSITFDVPWNPDMMSEIAKVELGIF